MFSDFKFYVRFTNRYKTIDLLLFKLKAEKTIVVKYESLIKSFHVYQKAAVYN